MVSTPSSPLVEPRRRLWSRNEYDQMADLGWFEGQRVELIDGVVMQTSPPKHGLYVANELCRVALAAVFGANYWVRMQAPLELLGNSSPEPELAVVLGNPREFKQHPTTALLIVEVSDATLAYDRQIKSALYARAGITDYWIVNLIDRQLEVFWQPAGDPAEPTSGHYDEQFVLSPEQSIAPLACASGTIRVSQLLP